MIEVNAKVTLERTLCLDAPEDANDEQVMELVGKEIIPPVRALEVAQMAFKKMNVNVQKLDLSDWKSSDVKYEIIRNKDNG